MKKPSPKPNPLEQLEQLYLWKGIHCAAMIDFFVFSIVILWLTKNFIAFLIPYAIAVLHFFLYLWNEVKILKLKEK